MRLLKFVAILLSSLCFTSSVFASAKDVYSQQECRWLNARAKEYREAGFILQKDLGSREFSQLIEKTSGKLSQVALSSPSGESLEILHDFKDSIRPIVQA